MKVIRESDSSDDRGSVSGWIRATRDGDSDAATYLLERYFNELEEFARRLLPRHMATKADEEDVVIEALNALLQGLRNNRFRLVRDRDDLWRMLLHITRRKATNLLKSENREKRDRKRTVEIDDNAIIEAFGGNGESNDPAWIAQFQESCRMMFEALPTDESRRIAMMRMSGHSVKEIAVSLDRTKSAIERKLGVIRATWARFL